MWIERKATNSRCGYRGEQRPALQQDQAVRSKLEADAEAVFEPCPRMQNIPAAALAPQPDAPPNHFWQMLDYWVDDQRLYQCHMCKALTWNANLVAMQQWEGHPLMLRRIGP